jgi:hypothetical protein
MNSVQGLAIAVRRPRFTLHAIRCDGSSDPLAKLIVNLGHSLARCQRTVGEAVSSHQGLGFVDLTPQACLDRGDPREMAGRGFPVG